MDLTIRDAVTADLEEILRLNEGAVPNVNSVDLDFMRWALATAARFRVATPRGAAGPLAGALLAFTPEADYASENFRWFRGHYPAFVYVDRIFVAPHAQRAGVGTALYDDLTRFAMGRAPRLTCEVNVRPLNQGSLDFHHGYGFREVGRQETKGGTVAVSLLGKELEVAGEV